MYTYRIKSHVHIIYCVCISIMCQSILCINIIIWKKKYMNVKHWQIVVFSWNDTKTGLNSRREKGFLMKKIIEMYSAPTARKLMSAWPSRQGASRPRWLRCGIGHSTRVLLWSRHTWLYSLCFLNKKIMYV